MDFGSHRGKKGGTEARTATSGFGRRERTLEDRSEGDLSTWPDSGVDYSGANTHI